jgi:hypothetical protein
MAKSKYITHHCAYCQKVTKMELVGQMESAESENGGSQRAWFRCIRCKHSSLIERVPKASAKGAQMQPINREECIEYAQNKIYSIGQAIYHSGFDDVGMVVGKAKISSGVHSITVSFEKVGERRLIENLAADASDSSFA